jgi:LL-diaminopimelate aminotransferase
MQNKVSWGRTMETAIRIQDLNSAIFTEMDKIKNEVEAQGVKVINLGIGSPDQPPAPHIQEAIKRGLEDMANWGYPTSEGTPAFRQAVAKWYKNRFDVEINPDNEVLTLMGSQDGLAHLALAYINPGDIALIPDPGYPIYSAGIKLAGGEVYPLPLVKEKGFLPDFADIPEEVARKAKLMMLNYPNNPIAATANHDFFFWAVEFAKKYDLIIAHDLAYSELAFDGYKPPSFLEVYGAKDVGVEFHSLSKTYNMAGCRIGFVVGNQEIVSSLAKIKSNIDYGVFKAVQEAGIAALEGDQGVITETVQIYQARRNILVEGLRAIGWQMNKPKASMFIWAPIPQGFVSSREFAITMLKETGVLVIPGDAFGKMGEGYVRIALVQEEKELREVMTRLETWFKTR